MSPSGASLSAKRPASLRDLARSSSADMPGESSMWMFASASPPAAWASLGQSLSISRPVRIRWESTRASLDSMRMTSCSLGISSEKMPTPMRLPLYRARHPTCVATFRQYAVLCVTTKSPVT